MAGAAVEPKGREWRAGSQVLALLGVPLNGLIVGALAKGPMSHAELHRELGNPAQTTLRGHLSKLESLGAVRRTPTVRHSLFAAYELSVAGQDLLVATRALEVWLGKSPQGPIPLGSEPAKGAVKALAGAWESMTMRALAGGPLSLTQLDSLIGSLSYPALERRLSAMRAAGLAAASKGRGRDGIPYVVTPWARQGIGPIASAAHFERQHMDLDTPRMAPIDVEAAFLLATPIVPLPLAASGVCDLIAETRDGSRRLSGVEVAVDRGKVVSCIARVGESPSNWVLGAAATWLGAVVHRRLEGLRIGGDRHLGCSLVYGLHELLYA
ncbi:MAG: HxlR-like helix-turn-helix [Solirubrobacterales bacterium]|jgi:DNA-binding HxlR family transcriptional regulator|nr:HxlR-like helix-turn-helix [Solirubrobacterales bacterium]